MNFEKVTINVNPKFLDKVSIMVDTRLKDVFPYYFLREIVSQLPLLHTGKGLTIRIPDKDDNRRGISCYRKPGGKMIWLESFPLYGES